MRTRHASLVTLLCAWVALPAVAPADAGAALPATWRKGVDVTAFWWEDLRGKALRSTLQRARDQAGAREVTFVVPWYQPRLGATTIRESPGGRRRCAGKSGRDWRTCKSPSLATVRAAVRAAQRSGLRVRLRPQVEVGTSDRTARPRKLINHGTTRAAWFGAYRAFLRPFARIARDEGAATLIVGTGLTGMTDEPEDLAAWRALVADVRSGALAGDGRGGYSGELSYGAMWDAIVDDALDPATHLFPWDALDMIGIEAFFPVASASAVDPTVASLRDGWNTARGGLPLSPVELVRRLRAEYAKPVWFTALGYVSRTRAAAMPERHEDEVRRAGGKLSQRAQARGVAAAFDVWAPIAREGWFAGISWWEWPAAARGGRGDGSFSVKAKLAQGELCRRHGARRCSR